MTEELAARKKEGEELLGDHLRKAAASAELFLSALKGFRRDLALSTETYEKNISAEFLLPVTGIAVPVMQTAHGYSDLNQMLLMCHSVLDGEIVLKNPKVGPSTELKEKLLDEARLAHRNLMDVAEMAHALYKAIQDAGFDFDVFNSKNLDVGHTDLNILFDRDAVYVAAATARAFGERAVRLDIDLATSIHSLETGQKEVAI